MASHSATSSPNQNHPPREVQLFDSLLAEPTAEGEVHAIACDRGRHLERAGGRRAAPGQDDGLADAAAARIDRGAHVDADVGRSAVDGRVPGGGLVDRKIGGRVGGGWQVAARAVECAAHVDARISGIWRAASTRRAAAATAQQSAEHTREGQAGQSRAHLAAIVRSRFGLNRQLSPDLALPVVPRHDHTTIFRWAWRATSCWTPPSEPRRDLFNQGRRRPRRPRACASDAGRCPATARAESRCCCCP